jgi:hypothetical protein
MMAKANLLNHAITREITVRAPDERTLAHPNARQASMARRAVAIRRADFV